MPNRIIKESICSSETLNALSAFDETFFYRLIVNCDDFGRMDARPSILKAKLYPLKNVRLDAMEKSLAELTRVGTIEVYEVDGKPYLQVLAWETHQTRRASKSKYPDMPTNITENRKKPGKDISRTVESSCMQLNADENGCKQMSPYSYSGTKTNAGTGRAREEPDSGDGDVFSMSSEVGHAHRVALDGIEAAWKDVKGSFTPHDLNKVNLLLADYPADWILEAIEIAGNGKEQTWRYVDGILRKFRENGGPDSGMVAPEASKEDDSY